MSIFFLSEILQNIFKFIDEDDLKTLHPVLLVNRTWCQNILKFVWKNPFSIVTSFKNVYKIIPILLSNLDIQRKNYLLINEPELGIPRSTLFDYPFFIKQIHFGHIYSCIDLWINKTRNVRALPSSDHFSNNHDGIEGEIKMQDQEIFAFFEAIFDIITSKSENIQYLSLCYDTYHQHMYTTFYQKLLSTPNAKNCFTHLENLDCFDYWFKEGFFNSLIEVSRNIKSINIHLDKNKSYTYKDGEAFENLIKSQKYLEEFIIKYYFRPIDLNKILNPLVYQIHSLKSIQIYNGYIDNDNTLKFLIDCKQLKELRFNHVQFNSGSEILKNINFRDLEVFHFNNISFSEVRASKNLLSSIFVKNKNLQEISLLINLKYYPDDLLDAISKNCENLKCLTVEIRQESDIPLLFPVMKNCQQLKSLSIPFGERLDLMNFVLENIEEFAQIIPLNLTTLDITKWMIFDINPLDNLLQNLSHPIKCFKFRNFYEDSEQVRNLIDNYSREKNLEIIQFDMKELIFGNEYIIRWK